MCRAAAYKSPARPASYVCTNNCYFLLYFRGGLMRSAHLYRAFLSRQAEDLAEHVPQQTRIDERDQRTANQEPENGRSEEKRGRE